MKGLIASDSGQALIICHRFVIESRRHGENRLIRDAADGSAGNMQPKSGTSEGPPGTVFIFLINPLASYLGDLGRGLQPDLAGYWGGGAYAARVMWFVAALLAFSLAYALLRRLYAPPAAHRWSGAQVMVAAAVLIAVTAFLLWRWWPPDDASTFLDLRWQSWPQGAALFALGAWAGEAGSLENLTAWTRWLGWAALAAAALFVALGVYEQARGQLDSTLHSASWPSMLGIVLYGTISVAFTVWFTALIRARWPGDGPLRAHAGRPTRRTSCIRWYSPRSWCCSRRWH